MRRWIATVCVLLLAKLSPAAMAADAACLFTDGAAGRAGVSLTIDVPAACVPVAGMPVVVVHAARRAKVELRVAEDSALLPVITQLPGFRGSRDSVYGLPADPSGGSTLHLKVGPGGDAVTVNVTLSTLQDVLDRGEAHGRMIDFVVGALVSMATAALLIWFVLADRLFLYYAALFLLQSLYIGYLSGRAFDWPVLSIAGPLTSFAWNVPVGLSGAVACLFTRDIADLQSLSPRVYRVFGWFAVAFVIVTIANVAKLAGLGLLVNAMGNLVFLAAAVFTIIATFWSWRRGNRAAGWFLLAWAVLEGFTIAAALRFLVTTSEDSDALLYYYGLPLSMVAAAVLIALGVADRLRQQRVALSDAERRARIDPLTGVLNRRSLIERLDAACQRARARSLPIAVLFIDLDHFKLINDSYGHQAGDACLRAIIGPVHAELRQSDVIGRYGGEEFVVVLSSADAVAAEPIAQRILERVANVRVAGFGEPIRLTCSIGVAASDRLGVWGEHLIARADEAVYAAKRAGRNQLHMAAAHAMV